MPVGTISGSSCAGRNYRDGEARCATGGVRASGCKEIDAFLDPDRDNVTTPLGRG